jgi:hypothetical protein
VTWRQHRTTLIWFAIALGVLATFIVAAGFRGHANYAALIRHGCLGTTSPGSITVTTSTTCAHVGSDFPWLRVEYTSGLASVPLAGYTLGSYATDVTLAIDVIFLLFGMFLGAPLLAREFDQGTIRFAWTQGAGPLRWCAVKLTTFAAATIVAGAAIGLLASWSLQPFNELGASDRWQNTQFGTAAGTAAGWAVLAFMLGVLAGLLIRRSVPAMAATAAALTGLLGLTYWKLNHLLLASRPLAGPDPALAEVAGLASTTRGPLRIEDPVFFTGAGRLNSGPPGSLLLRGWYTGPDGHRVTGGPPAAHLVSAFGRARPGTWASWLAQHHYAFWVSYQPGSRYWIFQSIEGGTMLVVALLLGAATLWLVRLRRV